MRNPWTTLGPLSQAVRRREPIIPPPKEAPSQPLVMGADWKRLVYCTTAAGPTHAVRSPSQTYQLPNEFICGVRWQCYSKGDSTGGVIVSLESDSADRVGVG